MPTALPASPDTATRSLPLAASPEPPSRYQVQSVLWGNRRRFVVRDTANDTTIAIRTTSQTADSDLIRLNVAARTDCGPRPGARPAQTYPASAPRDQQCGRCRLSFSADPAREAIALQDWWLCEPCRDALLGAHRSSTG